MKVPHTQSNRHARRAFAAEMSKRLRTSGVTIIEVQHDDYCSLMTIIVAFGGTHLSATAIRIA